ncbi:Plug domain-containing protein [Rhabdobacter roseus]|uniref:MG2 domain-containing protein n=1 Tax=Rhabdobacter roseus TaxID=1655419 RepID=A0A840TIE3_9BACT|nr:hypothetical protein [Rhabdobacter roseus]MBB5283936.1 hypothetical protein [Rhabdobacter roseus]
MKYFNFRFSSLLSLLALLAGAELVQAQPGTLEVPLRQLKKYRDQAFQEKIFVHLDRPTYLIGETMWFKMYYVEGTRHHFLDASQIAYLDVLDKDQNPVLQTKIALHEGRGNGALILPATLASGHYTVRSYTNWMKNFSPDFYFQTTVTILNPFRSFEPPPPVVQAQPYDLQFFPEGGQLVRNVEGRVGFRALAPNGAGLGFQGTLRNQHNDTLLRFSPLTFGIGSFTFTPTDGNDYHVLLTDSLGRTSTHRLPAIREQGYGIQVLDASPSALKVIVTARMPEGTPPQLYLLAHTRSVPRYTQAQNLRAGRAEFLVPKDSLSDGITHLTLFNFNQQPVAERLYCQRPASALRLEAKIPKKAYQNREKVPIELTTQVGTQAPAAADLSVAVYLLDSLSTEELPTIENYLWLTSDLKGTVESPDYYLTHTDATATTALDNLMLTHGWSRFRWDEVLAGQSDAPEFLPEFGGHFVQGRLSAIQSGTPIGYIDTYLSYPARRAQLFVSRTDPQGNIRFELKNVYGPKEIILQTNTGLDSVYRMEILSPFSDKVSARPLPAFSFDKGLKDPLLNRSIHMQTTNAYSPAPSQLTTEPALDSLAFYGIPNRKYFLDDYTRFPTMEEVMREYVPEVSVRRRQGKFHYRIIDKERKGFFEGDPLVLLDGVPVFNTNQIIAFDPLKVKKMEVMDTQYILGSTTFQGVVSYFTYKGDLAGFPLNPHALVMSYEGVQAQREFYAPRYDLKANQASRMADFRNLLYWAPTVVTDATGKHKLDFYTSDQPGTYRVVVQGMTGQGQAGSTSLTFTVNKRTL